MMSCPHSAVRYQPENRKMSWGLPDIIYSV